MNAGTTNTLSIEPTTRQDIVDFLHREARLLDDREWDEWLACYAPEVRYWMPSWDDDDQPTEDPQSEISLIYYPTRDGLEDRIFRIKTERSGATSPEPRTCHMLSGIEILSDEGGAFKVRYNWHTLAYRFKAINQFFGTTWVTLAHRNGSFAITDKKILLKNDYIHQVIDIYHV